MMITVLHSCRVFDGTSADLIENAHVVVEGNRIREFATGTKGITAARQIDCAGQTLMPGLIDAHFHANSQSTSIHDMDHMPPSLLVFHAARILSGALSRGFTTVRDAGGAGHELARALEERLIQGPRMFYSGLALSQTGGHGDFRPVDFHDPCSCAYSGTLSVIADGTDEVRKAAREQLRKGAHQVKIFASGGVISPTDPMWMPQYTEMELRAAVEEAASRRSYVMAHCHAVDAVQRCIRAGVRTIEHGSMIDQATAEQIAASGAYVVPTLAIADGLLNCADEIALPVASRDKLTGIMEQTYQSIEFCRRAGVNLGLGTDLFGSLHRRQGREFTLRREVEAAIDVLRSATSINAEILQQRGQLGCIAPGALADLLVVNGNPLQDLGLFVKSDETISLIMLNGELIRNRLDVLG